MADTMRAVPESVLEEALEQIEATWERSVDHGSGTECGGCERRQWQIMENGHAPNCRYVRVVEALKKAMGR